LKRAFKGFVLDVLESCLQLVEQFSVLCSSEIGDAVPKMLGGESRSEPCGASVFQRRPRLWGYCRTRSLTERCDHRRRLEGSAFLAPSCMPTHSCQKGTVETRTTGCSRGSHPHSSHHADRPRCSRAFRPIFLFIFSHWCLIVGGCRIAESLSKLFCFTSYFLGHVVSNSILRRSHHGFQPRQVFANRDRLIINHDTDRVDS